MSNVLAKRLASTFSAVSKTQQLHTPIPNGDFPLGYLVTGLYSGVKKTPSTPDLALLLSTTEKPAAAAACYTKNAFKAAPVQVCMDVLKNNSGRARAIVVNSGCANAVTGRQGLDSAWKMARETDSLLPTHTGQGSEFSETLVMSTGVIGQQLPISSILNAIQSQGEGSSSRSLARDFSSWERAAQAFMTTDTFPKLRAKTFTISGTQYRIAGIDKGAGMIHPNMAPAPALHATLLGCILTDAPVSPSSLQSALTYAVARSFNSISVDGDMSTNDTILVLANGAAKTSATPEIDESTTPEAFIAFRDELTLFAADLAKLVVRDGEGATKFVTVTVKGAPTYEDAHAIGSRISTSALVKTALYGQDANWGRILAATGSVPISKPIDPSAVCVSFVPSDGTATLPLLVRGEPENVDEERASEILSETDFEILVDLGMGNEQAVYYTCDFSHEYVSINGDYRS